MKLSMRARKSILLAAAFASLLLIIGISAFAIWRTATNAQARVDALHGAHLEAGNALASIRANVYLIGILTRDYLLDPDLGHARQYTEQFVSIRNATADSFRILAASTLDEAQQSALERLRGEVDAYWDPTVVVLDWTSAEKEARRAEFLRERVRRREEIIGVVSQVEQLMAENFARERGKITTANREFRSSLALTTGIVMLLGLGIAGVTLARMIALERQSQMDESELRRLSGQARFAQEQERKYLSRELHDQVGQMLTGLRLELSSMERLHDDPESELTAQISHSKDVVEQTLRIVRNIAMLLRPSMLDDLGLTPALMWLVKEVSRSSGIEIEAEIEPALDSLPDTHRTCLYRVVQEALTNVSRHSGAGKVKIVLTAGDSWVSGTVTDDGRGFNMLPHRREGLGLVGMQERARELGGLVRVVSALGQGTRVEIRLPVPKGPEVIHDSDPDRGRSWDRSDRVETSA